MRLWIGAEPSLFHPKDIFIYFKTIESKMASTSYHSCQNCLSTRPDWSSNLPKKAPGTMDFVQCEGSRGVLQVLDLPIFIMWTWLRVVGLRMVLLDQLPDFSHQNMSSSRHEINMSEELALVKICSDSAMLRNS